MEYEKLKENKDQILNSKMDLETIVFLLIVIIFSLFFSIILPLVIGGCHPLQYYPIKFMQLIGRLPQDWVGICK